MIWPLAFCWSWLAFVLQKLVIFGLPSAAVPVLQHTLQTCPFVFVMYMVYVRDWGFSQTIFSTFLAFSHFMKMHSYTMVNRDLREKKDKQYPSNVTVANYFHYLVAPTLVYQTSYPLIPAFRPWYFIQKVITMFVQLLFMYLLIEDQILPTLALQKPILETTLRLMFILAVFNVALFEIIFDTILNGFAELSQFADR